MRLRGLAAVGLAAALLAAGCGGDDDGGTVDAGSGSESTTTTGDRTSLPPSDRATDGAVTGIDSFAFAFQRLAAEPDENLVFSPTSIATAFAMARAGASEETAATLDEAFGFPEDVDAQMQALLAGFDRLENDDLELALANQGWVQEGRELGQDYLDTIEELYGATVEEADLQGDPSGSRDEINEWVAEQTGDRIPELLPDGFISDATLHVLVNAIYLKAAWAQQFIEANTTTEDFTRPDGSTVDADMMHNSELGTRYLDEDGLQVVDLPYVGDQLAMRVVIPDDLAAFEQDLDTDEWQRIDDALTDGVVDLSFPRFEIETNLDLAEPLGELGVEIPGGDYSGISPGLPLTQAVHGANITVDEAGTEAAAATALGFDESAIQADATIRADRPFLYAIVHQPSGLILFSGRVTDPTA